MQLPRVTTVTSRPPHLPSLFINVVVKHTIHDVCQNQNETTQHCRIYNGLKLVAFMSTVCTEILFGFRNVLE